MDSPSTKATPPVTTSQPSLGKGLVRSIGSLFDRLVSGYFRSQTRDPRHRLGLRGEREAARFLRRSGYKILYRRYRAKRGGEVDLVCRHGDTLVFAEVKTRSPSEFGRPADAVGADKRRLIVQGAESWLRLLGNPEIYYRFDIVEVYAEAGGKLRCEIMENAFTTVHERLY